MLIITQNLLFALQIVTRKKEVRTPFHSKWYYQMSFPDWVTNGRVIQGRLIKDPMVQSWFFQQILLHNLLNLTTLQFSVWMDEGNNVLNYLHFIVGCYYCCNRRIMSSRLTGIFYPPILLGVKFQDVFPEMCWPVQLYVTQNDSVIKKIFITFLYFTK